MEYEHDTSYFYKKAGEIFDVTQKFVNDLGSGETLSSATATVIDSSGVDRTTSLINSVSNSATNVTVSVKNGVAGETYQIKIAGVSSVYEIFTYYITCEVFGEIGLNTVLGDSKANSYVTVKEANDYIRNKYGHPNKWDAVSIEGKKRLLIEATKIIDRYNFIKPKYYDSQSLSFPLSTHEIITGNCATPITITSFKNVNLKSSTYGKYPTSYWKTGAVHITSGTPIYDTRVIASSNVVTGSITTTDSFSATPTTNSSFIVFAPLFKEVKDAQCEQALFLIDSPGGDTIQNYTNAGAKEVEIGDVRVVFGSEGALKTNISPIAKKLLSRWLRTAFRIGRA